ncbi:MAG: TRAP transporter small permease [Proteobacteria bacterium]|nr:TRAP transporter small permease [Pseudomonadota bacterium]MBU1450179.1 TRAP transporter small permease [Pseudomonadota bacterium]MBU2468911.1 TRAP transporter small permease [Pseudomonadota bacterium]MBU2517226.1 TRAP transporter small permease [Pseudomonadota bacterium]
MFAQAILSGFRRVFNPFVNVLTGVAVLLMLPMMFLVTADVIGRYIFNKPIPAVFEINSYFIMVAVVFFPLAYVQRKKEHVFITLFTERLSSRVKAVLDTFSLIVGFVAYGLIGIYSLQRAIMATEVREYISGIIDMPVWLSKWIIPIGCLAFCIELLLDALENLPQIAGREADQEVPRG